LCGRDAYRLQLMRRSLGVTTPLLWRVVTSIPCRVAARIGLALLSAGLAACASHPSDAILERRFAAHRAGFEVLVAMAQADSHVVRIAPNFTWLDSDVSWPRPASRLGFSVERWHDYRERFEDLGVDLGISRSRDEPGVVFLIASGSGMVTGGSGKGYAYSVRPLSPRLSSLDRPATYGQHDGRLYKPLGGPWYLFYDWGG
jgi:hypothetical protein